MKERDTKVIIIEIILTIIAVGQIVLCFILYNKNGNSFIRNFGWVVLWISAIFGWLPIYTFKKYGKVPKGKAYVHTTQLVDKGVYAIVRHPQYLAGILMAIAFFLIAQHWLVGILGIVLIFIYYQNTYDEEKKVMEKIGENYKQYMKRVPRLNFILGIVRLIYKR